MEEYFLTDPERKYSDISILLIYRNSDSVVCGKNQSLWAELNLKYCRQNHIKISRRLSGGGTVYHDEGNINYSYITPKDFHLVSNFKPYNEPVLKFLNGLGIKAYSNERNDLLIDGKKISGNAQHLSKNRMVSHATLLFDADLKNVSASLKIPFKHVKSKAIDSKRVSVTNIAEYLGKYDRLGFLESFISFFQDELDSDLITSLSSSQVSAIADFQKNKFETESWIYGNSPKTSIESEIIIKNESLKFIINLEKGRVTKFHLDENKVLNPDLIKDFLANEFFHFQNLSAKLKQHDSEARKDLEVFLELCEI